MRIGWLLLRRGENKSGKGKGKIANEEKRFNEIVVVHNHKNYWRLFGEVADAHKREILVKKKKKKLLRLVCFFMQFL